MAPADQQLLANSTGMLCLLGGPRTVQRDCATLQMGALWSSQPYSPPPFLSPGETPKPEAALLSCLIQEGDLAANA